MQDNDKLSSKELALLYGFVSDVDAWVRSIELLKRQKVLHAPITLEDASKWFVFAPFSVRLFTLEDPTILRTSTPDPYKSWNQEGALMSDLPEYCLAVPVSSTKIASGFDDYYYHFPKEEFEYRDFYLAFLDRAAEYFDRNQIQAFLNFHYEFPNRNRLAFLEKLENICIIAYEKKIKGLRTFGNLSVEKRENLLIAMLEWQTHKMDSLQEKSVFFENLINKNRVKVLSKAIDIEKHNDDIEVYWIESQYLNQVMQLMRPYFSDEDYNDLREVLIGKKIDRKLIFEGEANKLIDIFWNQLHKPGHRAGRQEKYNSWIRETFQFKSKGGEVCDFQESTVSKYLKGAESKTSKPIPGISELFNK